MYCNCYPHAGMMKLQNYCVVRLMLCPTVTTIHDNMYTICLLTNYFLPPATVHAAYHIAHLLDMHAFGSHVVV